MNKPLRQEDRSLPLRGKISGAYITSSLAKTEAVKSGFDEALLLNSRGKVSEASGMNLFIVRDGILFTPGVDQDILEGITRASVIELARSIGIEVVERPIDKTELFIDSMFHITIENNKADDYFTEKLIDCFVSMTIPIYYGCPNIGAYFNIRGMIIINDINDIEYLNNNLSEKFYSDRISYVEENYGRVLDSLSFKEQFINIVENKHNLKIIEK
jgi:hypothetical protein